MYLSVFLVVTGEALLFLSVPLLVYLGLVALVVQLFVVGYEEPTLTEQFGDEYRAYRAPRAPLGPPAPAHGRGVVGRGQPGQ